MQSPQKKLTHFSRARISHSHCLRPDTENELRTYLASQKPRSILMRGAGLSYNDSCFNTNNLIIDSTHFNHFIDFDPKSGIVVCQAHITFFELLTLHKEFIPAVLPGTLHATLGGGVAHDIHGKNNHLVGSLGHHIEWLELLINEQKIRCSSTKNADLFYATIGGLGLTGIILRVALRLKKESSIVQVKKEHYSDINRLLQRMVGHGLTYDYQVAWLDLLCTKPKGVLSLATHAPEGIINKKTSFSLPKIPLPLINKWSMPCFNSIYFTHQAKNELMSINAFNNPLDAIKNWNYLYGANGLVQFQAVFSTERAEVIVNLLLSIINKYKATPTLCVLKLFTQSGIGLLSFAVPGFTLAIDFINNNKAQHAIKAMNQLISQEMGRIYLAKDLFLSAEQFKLMYKNHDKFTHILSKYQSPMSSDLSRRLGII